MAFTETGKEKEKREAYYKANKEKGIRAEKERDYKMFGTTEQNIPAVDTMGNVTGMKKGGKVKRYNGEEGSEVFSKAEPHLKKAYEKMDKSLGVTKETPVELQKSFAEKLANMSKSGASGAAGSNELLRAINKPYKAGGSVKSASSRADGCCIRGKTKA